MDSFIARFSRVGLQGGLRTARIAFDQLEYVQSLGTHDELGQAPNPVSQPVAQTAFAQPKL